VTSPAPSRPATLALLGANGMLGRDLAPLARDAGWEVLALDLPACDITREADLAAAVAAAPVLVNCAAYTEVDRAESEPEPCRRVNAEAPARLGALAARAGAYVLHLGTDYVFGDDGNQPLDESAPTRPLGAYGASKLAGEQGLAASGCRHAVMRVQWTYGKHGRNFIGKILAAARERPLLRVVDDQVGAPTWTRDVAQAILRLLDLRATGLFHFAAAGQASRCAVARFALAACGLATPVVPCLTADFPTPARRPLNSRFDCRKIDALLAAPRPTWQDALRDYLHACGEAASPPTAARPGHPCPTHAKPHPPTEVMP
jgi:dTDP-4-dehydrorhamnose reductase